MLSSDAIQMAASIKEQYLSLPQAERQRMMRSVGHEWIECASDGRIRKRLVGWSRQLSAQECSKITGRTVNEDELREMRAAVGALVILDDPEQVRAVGRKITTAVADSPSDREEMLKEMLSDLPPDSLRALYIER